MGPSSAAPRSSRKYSCVLALVPVLFCAPSFSVAQDRVAGAPVQARVLIVHVSDRAPGAQGGYRRSADNSWTVSTTGSGSPASPPPPDNSVTLSTSSGERVLRLLEGERFLLDLPSVQSLQFRVPVAAAPARTPAPAGAPSRAAVSPSAEGVVYFEAVSAFAARLRVQGRKVQIELTPVLPGTVRAPIEPQAPVPARAQAGESITVESELGRWKGLGGGEGAPGSLSAAPPTEDALWIRVDLE
jgi:hypothetical protein